MPFLWFGLRRDSRANDRTNTCPNGHAYHGGSYGLADNRAHHPTPEDAWAIPTLDPYWEVHRP